MENQTGDNNHKLLPAYDCIKRRINNYKLEIKPFIFLGTSLQENLDLFIWTYKKLRGEVNIIIMSLLDG
jgi:hypothetical protein